MILFEGGFSNIIYGDRFMKKYILFDFEIGSEAKYSVFVENSAFV